ncbi:cytochrome P450, partial [Streptomyces sp. NPDC059744]|uniref:cytochrome P450 n=1 Tax=Streptomyces sp. NPDC059744 TaxID=3346929 RepID=UPI00365B254F
MTPPAASVRSVQPPQPLALYGPDFAADPHGHYRRLRAHGPLAPVRIAAGIDALLVTDYQAAVDLLRDTHTFTKDPRAWQATVPADSPVLPMLGYRPTPHFSDGDVHARYRDAINDGLAMIEPHVLRAEVARVARRLIREFAASGSGDLVAQYARRLPLHVFTTWFGVPPEDRERIVDGIGGMFNSADDAAAAYADLVTVVTRLVADRRARPRRDLTSYFLGHPAGLDNDETVRQITLVMSAGHDPTTNLIGNALLHMLTDARYAGSLQRGAMTAHEAINEVLWQDPPLANLAAHYPRQDTEFHGVRLRAGQLLLVSNAAPNTHAAPPPTDPRGRTGGPA